MLPFHNAARVDAAFLFLQLSRRTLSLERRFTVGGDAKHYACATNAAFLLLVLVLPFAMLLGSTMAFFSANARTATARYRAFTTISGDAALCW